MANITYASYLYKNFEIVVFNIQSEFQFRTSSTSLIAVNNSCPSMFAISLLRWCLYTYYTCVNKKFIECIFSTTYFRGKKHLPLLNSNWDLTTVLFYTQLCKNSEFQNTFHFEKQINHKNCYLGNTVIIIVINICHICTSNKFSVSCNIKIW